MISNEASAKSLTTEEVKNGKIAQVPMKRLGKPEEYGHLAAFLASDYAAYITGTSIPIDGGLTKGY